MDQSATLMKRFDLRYPIIQAPLAGGGDTPELVAAVCNADGIGFIGAAYLTPEQIRVTAGTVRKLTARPFGVNLFAPMPTEALLASAEAAIDQVGPYFEELGLPAPGYSRRTPSKINWLCSGERGISVQLHFWHSFR
jgi:nitronate monooxygenase